MGNLHRAAVWPARAGWATLPLTAGPALSQAVSGRSAVLWAAWAAVLLASLVPHPVSLSVLRVGATGSVVVVAVALVAGDAGPVASVGAVGAAAAAALVALSPAVGRAFVNGPAYPGEVRFPLRAPAPVLAAGLPLAWAVCVGLPVAAVLLLGARRWVAGAVVTALGGPVVALGARAVHGLARRWIVFVPAGVVVHDPLALADPVLFLREVLAGVEPAAGVEAGDLDLRQAAPGLAVRLRFRESVAVVVRSGETLRATSLLVVPTRPGLVLAEAGRRQAVRPST